MNLDGVEGVSNTLLSTRLHSTNLDVVHIRYTCSLHSMKLGVVYIRINLAAVERVATCVYAPLLEGNTTQKQKKVYYPQINHTQKGCIPPIREGV